MVTWHEQQKHWERKVVRKHEEMGDLAAPGWNGWCGGESIDTISQGTQEKKKWWKVNMWMIVNVDLNWHLRDSGRSVIKFNWTIYICLISKFNFQETICCLLPCQKRHKPTISKYVFLSSRPQSELWKLYPHQSLALLGKCSAYIISEDSHHFWISCGSFQQ